MADPSKTVSGSLTKTAETATKVSGAAGLLIGAFSKANSNLLALAAEANRIVEGAKKQKLSTAEFQISEGMQRLKSIGTNVIANDIERLRKSVVPRGQLDAAISFGEKQRKVDLTSVAKRGPEGIFNQLDFRAFDFERIFGSDLVKPARAARISQSIDDGLQEAVQRNVASSTFDVGEILEPAFQELKDREIRERSNREFIERMKRNTPGGIPFDRITDTFSGISREDALIDAQRNQSIRPGIMPSSGTIGGAGSIFGFAGNDTLVGGMGTELLGTGLPQLNEQFAEANSIGQDFEELFTNLNIRGQEFETIFSSAFDSLIAGGAKFSDVLKQLAIDIGKVILKQLVLRAISAAFGSAGGGATSLPDVGAFAAGGPLRAGQLALVGERGPELFVPGMSGSIIPNGRFGVAAGGPAMVIENIDARGADSQAVARLESTLRELGSRVDRVDRSVEPRVAGFMADRFIRRGTAKRVLKR